MINKIRLVEDLGVRCEVLSDFCSDKYSYEDLNIIFQEIKKVFKNDFSQFIEGEDYYTSMEIFKREKNNKIHQKIF